MTHLTNTVASFPKFGSKYFGFSYLVSSCLFLEWAIGILMNLFLLLDTHDSSHILVRERSLFWPNRFPIGVNLATEKIKKS